MAANDPSMPPTEAPTATPDAGGMPPGMPPSGPQGGDQMIPVPMAAIAALRDLIGQLGQGLDQILGPQGGQGGGMPSQGAPEPAGAGAAPTMGSNPSPDEEDLARFAQQLSNR